MSKFTFKIIEKCFQDASKFPGDDADFYLEENDWNDHNYYVSYYLHATKRITGAENKCLALIKIMKSRQREYDKYLLRKDVQNRAFEVIPEDYVSICFDRDFYRWLERRPQEERVSISENLHLILNSSSPYYEKVKLDDCFQKGLLRDSTMDNYIFKKAKQWVYNETCIYDLREESFEIKYNDYEQPIKIDFSCFKDVDSPLIPNGIVAFIGPNGSGKSTALYKLAKLMYLYPNERGEFEKSVGKIIPNDLGVERMIFISYSPFDNFTIPATENVAIRYAMEDPIEDDTRFIYCGIRDLNVEYKTLQKNGNSITNQRLSENRQTFTIPKTQDRLAADFVYALKKVCGRKDRAEIWEQIAIKAMKFFPDLSNLLYYFKKSSDIDHDVKELFLDLSTGYKFFVHSLAYLLAFIEEDTLVLFDEPENHIHPPLLSFMMDQYRRTLKHFKSVMLISTHSPVVIQELFSKNVYKVYRESDDIRIEKPTIETYGATFGEINSEVFGLTSDVSQYYNAIDTIYEQWGLKHCQTIEALLKEVKSKMGNNYSGQVLSYIIDKFYTDNPDAL